MTRAVIRPTTQADIDAFMEEPLPCRIQAVTIEVEGRILGIGGIAYLPNGVIGMFSEITDELREKYPIALHKSGMMMMEKVRALGPRTVKAIGDTDASPAAERWLKWFGFSKTEDGMFQWQP